MPEIVVNLRMLRSSGIGTYLRHVAPAVAAALPEVRFSLLGDPRELDSLAWSGRSRIRLIPLTARTYSPAEQWGLARLAPAAWVGGFALALWFAVGVGEVLWLKHQQSGIEERIERVYRSSFPNSPVVAPAAQMRQQLNLERARHGLLRCGDNAYDRVHKPYQHSCQYHRSCHKQRDCVANEPRRTKFVLCAHGPANSDRCSHGKAHDHHSDHMHHLTANGHRRCAGHTFKLPDDEQIRHAVQRLQKVRKQIGQ